MKKHYSTIMLLLIMMLQAATINARKLDTHAPMLLDSIVYTINSSWCEKHVYTYDANYNLLSEIYTEKYNNSWNNRQKYLYEYDSFNNTIAEEAYSSTGEDWTKYTRKETTYFNDDEYSPQTIIEYTAADDQWVAKTKAETFYTQFGDDEDTWTMPDSVLVSEWEDGAWVLTTKYEYAINMETFEQTSIEYTWNNGAWEVSGKTEYLITDPATYSSSYTTYGINQNEWVPMRQTTETYDNNGNCTETASYYWYDETWKGESKIETTYDDNNNETEVILYHWESDAWVNYSKSLYSYEKKNFVYAKTAYDFLYWRTNKWVLDRECTYTNDKYGNPTYCKEMNFDTKGNVTSTHYENLYYHDRYQQPTSIKDATDVTRHLFRKQLVNGRIIITAPNGKQYDVTGKNVK